MSTYSFYSYITTNISLSYRCVKSMVLTVDNMRIDSFIDYCRMTVCIKVINLQYENYNIKILWRCLCCFDDDSYYSVSMVTGEPKSCRHTWESCVDHTIPGSKHLLHLLRL